MNCKNQTVFIGDNREVMLGLNSGCIDLIATDPPFNKEKRFDHNFGSPKGYKPGFDDKWDGWLMTSQRAEELTLLEKCHPKLHRLCNAALEMHSAGMQGYLVMMAVRLLECHRLLKETGSIYLHCDHSANAYLRLLMDGIFGEKNFRNEIVWSYRKMPNAAKMFQHNHDTVLLYVKNAELAKFNRQYEDYAESSLRTYVRAKKIGYNVNLKKRMVTVFDWAKYKEAVKSGALPNDLSPSEFKGLGVPMRAVWDLPIIAPTAKERSGWRTQKPLALYSRMILASSNPGDVVLDPFCGCATTLVAAENAGRQWIGIDRAEEAEEQVRIQLGKLNENSYDFWRSQVIIRKCDKKHKEWPVRNDLGEFQHYKKHFDRLYTEQAGICAGCGKHYDPNVMHVDHDFPRSKGGQDNIENLQVLCSGCNSRKGTGTLSQLREKNRRLGLLKE